MTSNDDRSTLVSPAESGEPQRGRESVITSEHPTGREPGQLRTGELLDGRFRIIELVQSGGMGDVYQAEDLTATEVVAVKVLRSGASTLARFEREAVRLSELNHSGIPRYIAHDLSSPAGAYLVMEWFAGESLSERLRGRSFGVRSSIDLIAQIVSAVAHAHERGIIHRDLNPNNILLSRTEPCTVKVLDFGIAKLTREDRPLTAEGTQIGTPGYMAPEQVEGRREVGAPVDVFALGCILYEILCGQRAFYAPTIRELLTRIVVEDPPAPSEIRVGVPTEVDELVLSMLAKDPARRPPDARQVEYLLQALPIFEDSPMSSAEPSLVASSIQQVASVIVLRDKAENIFERAVRAADPHGLSVQRSTDGTIVAVTGGRGTASDHASRAARAALAIQRATRAHQMAVATGLSHTTGNVLSGRAFDSALVSLLLKDADAEMFSGPCLWLDENTAALLDSRFDIRSVEQGFLLRGLRETYEPARTVLGRRTRCVGRKRELSMLEATLSESFEDSSASAMLVTGVPGVGKTRIGSEIARVARRTIPFVQIFRGGADSISAGSPFSALTGAIARGFRIRDGDPDVLRREKLHARISEVLPEKDVHRVTEFMGELLNISPMREPSVQLEAARRDAVLRGDQILRALQDWLRGECTRHPVVLILDDFQWGDLPTVKFVDAALRNLSECPLVVFALGRPEIHDIFPQLWARRGLTELRLSGLSRRAASEMVREVLGEDVKDEVIERVVQRAQGNPFWIEELLRAEDAGQGENVPDRVVLLAQSRIEQQSFDERRVLQAGSVFGREFWLGGIRAVLGAEIAAKNLDAITRDLAESEFILENEMSRLGGEREYQFSSSLLRDAAYSLLDDDDREVAHLRAAQWLERNRESDPLAIAMHFTLGGEADRARPYYLRAAEQALAGDDLDAAISCAEEGLGAGARGKDAVLLRLVHAEASKWRGDNALAFRSAQAAFARAEESSAEWYRAAAEAAVAAGKTGKTETSLAIAKELLESALRASTHGERSMAFARVAGQMALSGKTEMAEALLDAADRLQDRVQPDPQVMGFLCEARALLCGAKEDPLGRISHAERSVQYFEDAGDYRNACLARLSQGFAEIEFGANQEAIVTLQEALRIAQQMGLENSIAVAELQLGRALARTGDPHEGLDLLERAGVAFDRQRNVRLAGVARIYQAEVHLMIGATEAAHGSCERGAAILADLPPLLRLAHGMAAAIAARQDDPKRAGHWADLALADVDATTRLPVGETVARVGAATGLIRANRVVLARQVLQEERDRLVALTHHMTQDQAELFFQGCPARTALMAADLSSAEGLNLPFIEELERLGRKSPRDPSEERSSLSATALSAAGRERDPVLRLFWVTQSYHHISEALASVIDRQNLNWSTFAAQAARRAGQAIQRQEVWKMLDEEFGVDSAALRGLGELRARMIQVLGLRQALAANIRRCLVGHVTANAQLLARLHDELAPLLYRFTELMRTNPDNDEVTGIFATVATDGLAAAHRDLCKKALLSWYQASRTEDDRLRAQLILRGNCQLLLLEQYVVQERIQEVHELPIEQEIYERMHRRTRLLRIPLTWLTRWIVGDFLSKVVNRFRQSVVVQLLWSELPGESLNRGEQPRPSHWGPIPEDLRELTEPRIEAFFERFQGEAELESESPEWSTLPRRMALLVELYRRRQQDLAQFAPPFSPEQEKDLLAGHLPRDC